MPVQELAQRAVGFLDLAGYTSLTDMHGDTAAVAVVDRFCAVVRSALADGDVLVKSIGDAVLLVSRDPVAMAELSARVCTVLDAEQAFPVLRVGLHVGTVVLRDDDVFGHTVNLTARIAAQASGAQVLASDAFAAQLRPGDWRQRPVGQHWLKGVSEPVDLVELELCPHPLDRPIDPVCGMALIAPAAVVEAAGRRTSFCSFECLRRWTAALR